ncbi:MAG TPA: ABC transporter substrate-binding protein [Candidatus Limnocylindrales bacterium]|nr:ABC transporter substrate-binding protein [Candidatus Limnocylindrales bacterium]
MRKLSRLLALALGAVLVAGACTPGPGTGGLTKVRFQLQWVTQAQFAGYYAALEQGYFKEEGLDVTLLPGGPDINNLQVVASDGAELGTSWVPKTLQSREGGTDLVTIAQVLQRSGTRMVAFKESGITDPKTMIGRKIGSWFGGNEPELFAALTKAGADPKKENVIKQDFNMNAFIAGDIEVAQAMIYNEYAQVLETKNPKTGQLFKPEELNVIDFNDPAIGTAMLQDAIIARDSWLKKAGNEEVAVKFLKAAFRGWIYCRDNSQKCAELVVKAGSELKTGHQTWMMNEINGLIWPSPNGIGQFDQAAWDNTIDIAVTYGVLKAKPSEGAFRTDLAKKALDALGGGVDSRGASFQKAKVELKEGGN